MTPLQLGLLIAAVVLFYMLFKQLFSGNYPKRGVDYPEATTSTPTPSSQTKDKQGRKIDYAGGDK